jgi:hypothetical protein
MGRSDARAARETQRCFETLLTSINHFDLQALVVEHLRNPSDRDCIAHREHGGRETGIGSRHYKVETPEICGEAKVAVDRQASPNRQIRGLPLALRRGWFTRQRFHDEDGTLALAVANRG